MRRRTLRRIADQVLFSDTDVELLFEMMKGVPDRLVKDGDKYEEKLDTALTNVLYNSMSLHLINAIKRRVPDRLLQQAKAK